MAHLDAFASEDWEVLDEVVIDIAADSLDILEKKLPHLPRDRVRLALPMITRSWEEKALSEKIEALCGAGWSKWEAANASAWRFLKIGNLSTDWSVYVTNRLAALQVLDMGASRFTLSPEDGFGNMSSLLAEFGLKATVIVYQDTPLFVSETCIRESCPGPSQCDFAAMELTSSHGDRVLAVNSGCRTVVISRRPFCLAPRLDKLTEAGALSVRADFIFRPYRPEEVRDLWRSLRSGGKPDSHVGNFDRGLL